MSLGARTLRNTALVVGARMTSRLIVFYVFILIVRSTSDANWGRFNLLVVMSSLVSVIVDIGLRPLFIREAARDRAVLSPYLNSILSLKLVMALPAFVVLFIAVRLLLPDAVGSALLATLVMMLGASFANQTRAVFYAVADLRWEAITTIGETLVLLAGVVVGATRHLDWTWYLWAYAASWWFTVVYSMTVAVVRLGHRFRFDLNLARLSMLARESLPFALTFVISTLYYKVDQPLMKALGVSLVGLGVYAAAYKFLDAATFVPQALMDPVYPALSRLSHEAPERLQGATTKAYKMLAVAGLPVSITMIVLAAPIVRLVATSAYVRPGHSAVPVLQVLGLGVVFVFVNNTFIYTLNAMGRQSESTRLAVLSLVVNVVLNVILIPQRSSLYGGYMGAAWATSLTEVALFTGGFWQLRRYLFSLPLLTTLRGVLPAAGLCALAMFAVVTVLPAHLWVAGLALVAGGVVYAAALLGLRAFTPDELALAREGLRSRARS